MKSSLFIAISIACIYFSTISIMKITSLENELVIAKKELIDSKCQCLTDTVLTEMQMEVTGYSNDSISINVPEFRDGMTASNTIARRGVCAADWEILPKNSIVYIPNYGICQVEDKGGAIQGMTLDLFFDTYEEALAWGRVQKDVFVMIPIQKENIEVVEGE